MKKIIPALIGAIFAILFTSTAQADDYSISGRVWQDDNGNGVQDGAEPGVASVRVFLFDYWVYSLAGITTTDADGDYSFAGLIPDDGRFFAVYGAEVYPDFGGLEVPVFYPMTGDIPLGWIQTFPEPSFPGGFYFNEDPTFCFPSFGEHCTAENVNYGFQPAARVAVIKKTVPVRGDTLVKINGQRGNPNIRFPDQVDLFCSAAGAANAKPGGPGCTFDTYGAMESFFSPSLETSGPVSAPLVVARTAADIGDDLSALQINACGDPEFTVDMEGKIALIRRGGCRFSDKVINVQNAGAVGAIIMNNPGIEGLIQGVGDPTEIPAVFVEYSDMLFAIANAGKSATLEWEGAHAFGFDSSFGNFVLDTRLTRSIVSDNVAGAVSVTETDVPAGWSLDDASCVVTDYSDGVANPADPASFNLVNGEYAVCTFVNRLAIEEQKQRCIIGL
jgi:hypothetical protein